MPKQYLIPDLIPKTSWFNNLRSVLSQAEWDVVRKAAYRKAGYRCEICGGVGDDWPVECHEVWEFDDNQWYSYDEGIQYLRGVQALCPMCHKVKHLGLTVKREPYFLPIATARIATINDWSYRTAEVTIEGCFQQWRERSRKKWLIDYSRAPQEIQEMVKGVVDGRQGQGVRYEPREYGAQMELSELTVRQISALPEAARRRMEKFLWSKLNNAFSFDPAAESSNKNTASDLTYESLRSSLDNWRDEIKGRTVDPAAREAIKKTIGEGSIAFRQEQMYRDLIKIAEQRKTQRKEPKPRPIRKLRLEE